MEWHRARFGRRYTGRRTSVLAAAALCFASVFIAPTQATAAPVRAGVPAVVESLEHINGNLWNFRVYSPSMNRAIPLLIIRPADTSVPRPTLYMLNGSGGGKDGSNWLNQTDALEFFADKNVNVVVPLDGESSYYTDWIEDDPRMGRHKWATFLTRELPPVIDAALGTNGVNAISGMSMSATSVLNLAIQAPDLYKGVAAYSGCAQTSDPLGQAFVRTAVELRGGGDPTNMWGPYDGPGWRANDPYLHAEKLRGLSLYISTGSGRPGPYETALAEAAQTSELMDQTLVGGIIEVATNVCTRHLADRLDELDIPATITFRGVGTHSWGYLQDELHASWPQLAASLGLAP